MTANSPEQPVNEATARLGLWDAVSIIVGIVVGTSIFIIPGLVFSNVDTPWIGLGAWMLGGVLSFIGALCYAELTTTYPRMGGDYVYLSRAFGRPVGFLFGWAQLAVILTGSIGAMAYAFGEYTMRLFAGQFAEGGGLSHLKDFALVGFACAAVIVLSLLNLVGVIFGKTVQNILTVVKVVGLLAIVVAGFGWGTGAPAEAKPEAAAKETDKSKQPAAVKSETQKTGSATTADREKTSPPPAEKTGKTDESASESKADAPPKEETWLDKLAKFGLAMVFVLYAFGGWNDAAFVASEVRDRKRDIPWALFYGITGITVVYLLVNGGYLWGLGFDGLRNTFTPAADVLRRSWGEDGAKGISLLVMLSSLGALNGLIFTGSRIYTALGREHSVFAALGRWDPRLGVPVWSILAQAAVSLLLILAVGTESGRGTVDQLLGWLGFAPLPWQQYNGGFGTLVAGTAPVFWVFFLLTGVSLFVLRSKDPGIERPFTVPLYPVVPLIFCATTVYMLYSSMKYAGALSLLGFVPLAIGVPLYFCSGSTAADDSGA